MYKRKLMDMDRESRIDLCTREGILLIVRFSW